MIDDDHVLLLSHLEQGQEHVDALDNNGPGVAVLDPLNTEVLPVLGGLVLHPGHPGLEDGQLLLDVPHPLLALVLYLLLHVGHPGLDVLDLVLVKLSQIVHLLLQPLAPDGLLPQLPPEELQLLLEMLLLYLQLPGQLVTFLSPGITSHQYNFHHYPDLTARVSHP